VRFSVLARAQLLLGWPRNVAQVEFLLSSKKHVFNAHLLFVYESIVTNHIAGNYTVPPKRARFNLLYLGHNLTDLQNSFSVRKSMK